MRIYIDKVMDKKIDFKESIVTQDIFKRVVLIRFWKKYLANSPYIGGIVSAYIFNTIEKKEENITFVETVEVKNGKVYFDSYYHFGKRISKDQILIDEHLCNSLDDIYELHKQSLKLWENHLKNFVKV